ncbi:MAG: type II toxin-antitoxin system VapC family toxin [Candidatus Methanosuratus sp.]|nr:type II toxin-antitoxin system VapC family toxin [Candidatus Methanosuratincola sp.]
MKFLDANVFIYAYYKPKRELNQKERQMKESAKNIVAEISEGKEEVATTVVHLSEVAKILKHGMPINELNRFILDLFMLDNVKIYDVTKKAYFAATELGEELKVDPNDALAVEIMRANAIQGIYSFDSDFEKIGGSRESRSFREAITATHDQLCVFLSFPFSFFLSFLQSDHRFKGF